MCVFSIMGDHYSDKWKQTYVPQPQQFIPPQQFIITPPVTRAEFDQLKAEVENLGKLLALAKEVDKATGQPDCEMEEKIALIRAVAEAVGVDLGDVLN